MIYTSITGGKDESRDDIKCFDSYDRFRTPRMNAKIYKVLSHKFIPSEWSVWVDGNVFLDVDEDDLIEMTKPKEVGVFRHAWRDCIYEEAEACKRMNKGTPEIIDAQTRNYKMKGYPEENGLAQCSIIVRKHTSKVATLNNAWWSEITRWSVRDQISFPVIFSDHVQWLGQFPEQQGGSDYFHRKPHKK